MVYLNSPSCTKICIISNDFYLSSLLKQYLNTNTSYFVSTTNISNIFPNKDIYILFSSSYSDIYALKPHSGLKILISDHINEVFLRRALECGFTIFYDNSVNLKEFTQLGIHLCIYQRGSVDVDYDEIVKIVTQNKNFKRRYAKIQI